MFRSMTPSYSHDALQRRKACKRVAALALTVVAAAFGSCGGNNQTGGQLLVTGTDPVNGGRVFLNQSVYFRFSNEIDLQSVNFNSIAFQAKDGAGKSLSESVTGEFRYGRDSNDVVNRHLVEFVPRLPTNDTFDNGGFKPGRIYDINLVGGQNHTAPTVRDLSGNSVSRDSAVHSIEIRTVDGSTPQQLFRDAKFGGPTVVRWTVGPQDEASGNVSLNRLGDLPVEVRIEFDQPLNPSSTNVPLHQNLDPAHLKSRSQGRVFLEYDDQLGESRWIPANAELPQNDATGSAIVLRPDGVLPNNATIRVIVEDSLEDLSGESNRNNPLYRRIVGTFETEPAFEPQFDAVVLDFAARDSLLDPEAAFRDPVAEIQNGMLTAGFDFEGIDTPFDYRPTSKEVNINTNAAQIQPSNGPPLTVIGGVFSFHDIVIDQGIRVQASGSNPLVFLATGKVVVDGLLSVNGGDGQGVHTLNSATFPTAGGIGTSGGGNGGKASQETGRSTPAGETGYGPGQRSGQGGRGGQIACGNTNANAGGGGGGSYSTKGDPNFYDRTNAIVQGTGGAGASPGGGPGPLLFTDPNDDNNFWGRQVDDAGNVIVGEFTGPKGGSGGGGGGDVTAAASCNAAASFANDRKGGGGGGGAGSLVIKALGPIVVGETGQIAANGGNGGGGEWAASCRYGGGGGGGSGGMIVLMSATNIDLHTHKGRWSATDNWDSNFSISADGGIGTNGSFGGQQRVVKYLGQSLWNNGAVNRGAFGGLGVVQLMAPPGDDSDNTGTVQDDNIIIRTGDNLLTGTNKSGFIFDGDIRPDPILMPPPYGRNSQAQSRWISTGSFAHNNGAFGTTVRREVTIENDETRNRIIDQELGKSGPEYFFSGAIFDDTKPSLGYLNTNIDTGRLEFVVVRSEKVVSTQGDATTVRGRPAHAVMVEGSPLPVPTEKGGWSYANYQARLLNQGRKILDYRILDHTKSTLYLDAAAGPIPSEVDEVQIVAKFFDVVTGLGNKLTDGLGPVYDIKRQGKLQPERYPIANVQIGFAFHKDPANPLLNSNGTIDGNRYPEKVSDYLYTLDLENAAEREKIRLMHMPFVRMQVRFNLNYNPDDPFSPGPNRVGPLTEKPRLKFLFLPYRF